MRALLTPRKALLIALVLVTAATGAHILRKPRLSLDNQGLVLAYPPAMAAAPSLCAVGLLALALLPGAGRARLVCGALALAVGTLAAHSWRFRIVAAKEELVVSGVLSTERVGWKGVTRVTQSPSSLVVTRVAGRPLTVTTSGLTPQQRDTLERSVARRLREAGAGPAGAAAATSSSLASPRALEQGDAAP